MDEETIKRYMGALVEQVTDQVKIVAEGHMMLVERFDRVDERLDGMDRRFDRVDERLDGMDRRFDRVDERLDGMDRRFDRVDERLDAMDRRFDRVDERLDGMDHRLGRVEAEVTSLRTEFHVFQQEVGRQFDEVRSMIKLSYAEIDGRITALEKDLFTLRSRVERLEEKLLAS